MRRRATPVAAGPDATRPRRRPAPGTAAVLAALAAATGPAACTEEAPLTNPEPISLESPFRYPVELWDSGREGETVLMVHVTELGAVDSAYVLRGSGQPAFDSAALHGARDLRFAPGRRGERRVAMWARLPVRFRQRADTAAGPAPAGGP